jgi:hypothetical protein
MKLSDKLTKCSDNLMVNLYDNGFMVEVSGRDSNDQWKTAKIMCPSLVEVCAIIVEAAALPRE